MPKRPNFLTGSYYHVFSRGIEQRDIFLNQTGYQRFVSLIKHNLHFHYPYSFLKRKKNSVGERRRSKVIKQIKNKRIKPPVEIISYCLMPNHFHLTLKQLTDDGIRSFMHRLLTGYSTFFNSQNSRLGQLYESRFKAIKIDSDRQLIHLTRYHHLNPLLLSPQNPPAIVNYLWSSLPGYLETKEDDFINHRPVSNAFPQPQQYLDFILSRPEESKNYLSRSLVIDDDFDWY